MDNPLKQIVYELNGHKLIIHPEHVNKAYDINDSNDLINRIEIYKNQQGSERLLNMNLGREYIAFIGDSVNTYFFSDLKKEIFIESLSICMHTNPDYKIFICFKKGESIPSDIGIQFNINIGKEKFKINREDVFKKWHKKYKA